MSKSKDNLTPRKAARKLARIFVWQLEEEKRKSKNKKSPDEGKAKS